MISSFSCRLDEATLGTKLDDVGFDFIGNAHDHFRALHGLADVEDGDDVLKFAGT
jgi:hypothetical protein